ncbi:NifU family protein, partial [Arthrobacter sp. H14]|uniref:NifU family protein n=1 Tax=Arthrobacter sp. H14 TaxID=1312959 RepID=UPI000686BF41
MTTTTRTSSSDRAGPAAPEAEPSTVAAEQSDGDRRVHATGERIGTLLDALGAGGALARERAEDLVREVTDLYGGGLQRILEILDERALLDEATLDALTADELVSSLLIVHGLHPKDVGTRVSEALDSVRPYLGSHGGDVELLDISDDGVVTLRLLGSCHGCPSSSVTLKLAVEGAIESAAPEVTSIQVEQEQTPAASPALIPIEALRSRLTGSADTVGGSWEPVPEIEQLEPGEVAGFDLDGLQVLACRTGQDLYAFRSYCPGCTGAMAGA